MEIRCHRCSGLLIAECAYDLQDVKRIEWIRCVNCGHYFDDVSLNNRINPPQVPEGRSGNYLRTPHHKFAVMQKSRFHV